MKKQVYTKQTFITKGNNILGHYLLFNIGFWIHHTKLPLNKVSNPFLHKMPVLVKISDFL